MISNANIDLLRLPARIIWWHHVNERPLLSKIIVFNRGIVVAMIEGMKMGGHVAPVVISVHLSKAI